MTLFRKQLIAGAIVFSAFLTSSAFAQHNSPNNRSRASGGHRQGNRHNNVPRPRAVAQFPFEFRSIDGVGNNIDNAHWAAADVPFLRLTPLGYGDGLNSPSGALRPSPRAVSNAVVAQTNSVSNSAGATDYLWQWGQFLDHDITETPIASPVEVFDILVPTGDVHFDPFFTGMEVIPLSRSAYFTVDNVREQVNLITAFIDASNVYGSEDVRADALRTLDGTGKLKTSAGDLLPLNIDGLDNAGSTAATFFLAGDVRANEQVGLTAMHTLFVREHNYWATQIGNILGPNQGELIYLMARAFVGAEMQAITYREFLPLLLGRKALPDYRHYDPSVNAGISNVFATAAYRFGHTMLSSNLLKVDAAGQETSIALLNGFFNPNEISTNGIDVFLRGLAAQEAQKIDSMIVDDVRNFLFGPPGAGGFDLAALNIQRGRDHGLPDFNSVRVAFGLPAAANFAEVSSDAAVVANLAGVYATVDDMDPWIGLLAETHANGALVGPTLKRVLVDQFTRLRNGDRFWYEGYLSAHLVRFINSQKLSTIIRRNTAIGSELPNNVFKTALAHPKSGHGHGNRRRR
ncbi:MAG: peroxidase [Planctomycetota bacterium]|jgi:peroxidase